ncbi:hypothetical protein [Paraburkholderia sp. SIMBA_030]|uniref:hypothetical protein n=1 Tax=Paraburkholderia sp. SIMBA_030 TaxID=3085773 RepID=UPI00397E6104
MICADSCFTSPEVYVLVNEKAVAEPRRFHWLATELMDGKNAVRCFLSLSDAVLAAGIARATQDLVVAPAKAAQFGIEAFRSGDEYLAVLHVGWAAHQDRLLVSQDGVFATLGMPLRQPVSSRTPDFEVDARTLAMVGGLYEYAGMFAWRVLEAPILLDEFDFKLDDEFARRFGGGVLNLIALGQPDIKQYMTVTQRPLDRL